MDYRSIEIMNEIIKFEGVEEEYNTELFKAIPKEEVDIINGKRPIDLFFKECYELGREPRWGINRWYLQNFKSLEQEVKSDVKG